MPFNSSNTLQTFSNLAFFINLVNSFLLGVLTVDIVSALRAINALSKATEITLSVEFVSGLILINLSSSLFLFAIHFPSIY